MRFIWLIFGILLGAVLVGHWLSQPVAEPVSVAAQPRLPILAVVQRRPAPTQPPGTARADSLVQFSLAQLGASYCYAGTSPATGFDCSGFVFYVFNRFGVPTPRSTALLIDAGRPVPRAQAQPGDIVVFTGTAARSTTPGHAGIIISALGETPLRFVHASSAKRESGVKISQVEGSDYERRFMQVRRVLSGEDTRLVKPTHPTSSSLAASRCPAGAVALLASARPQVALPLVSPPLPKLRPLPSRWRSRVAAHPRATHGAPVRPRLAAKAPKRPATSVQLSAGNVVKRKASKTPTKSPKR